jgi:hypothetical protein
MLCDTYRWFLKPRRRIPLLAVAGLVELEYQSTESHCLPPAPIYLILECLKFISHVPALLEKHNTRIATFRYYNAAHLPGEIPVQPTGPVSPVLHDRSDIGRNTSPLPEHNMHKDQVSHQANHRQACCRRAISVILRRGHQRPHWSPFLLSSLSAPCPEQPYHSTRDAGAERLIIRAS